MRRFPLFLIPPALFALLIVHVAMAGVGTRCTGQPKITPTVPLVVE